jgi:hypothetical protein
MKQHLKFILAIFETNALWVLRVPPKKFTPLEKSCKNIFFSKYFLAVAITSFK